MEEDENNDGSLEDNDGEHETEQMSSDDEPMTANNRYNLRRRDKVNYRNMHQYGETQLMQMQVEWSKQKVQDSAEKGSKSKTLNMKSEDVYRRIVGTTFTQLAKSDKYAQVSVNEGIKRH